MRRVALALAATGLLVACASAPPSPSPAARADLAPTGKLRAGINYGNVVLVQKDPVTGESRGPAIELARELGKRLGVPVEIVAYTSASTMFDGARTGAWDIAFLGADPARAGEVDFTAAYLELEATYLVPEGSRLLSMGDVDQDGVRVAAPARAAYELYLSRSLQRANLVRVENASVAFELLATGRVEALAGLRQALVPLAEKLPGSRVLDGRFMAVQQAVGIPKGHDAGLAYLRAYVEEAKASGMVARSIEKTGFRGVAVAPRSP
jgi:polar amino acid transport system substrate-binding protein